MSVQVKEAYIRALERYHERLASAFYHGNWKAVSELQEAIRMLRESLQELSACEEILRRDSKNGGDTHATTP